MKNLHVLKLGYTVLELSEGAT